MTIEISEKTLGLWYVELPENAGNWMASAWLNDDGTPLATYRFRFYRDNATWDSKDEKSWRTIGPNKDAPGGASARTLIDAISEMARFIETSQGRGQRYELIRGEGSIEWFMEELSKLPFFNMKTAKNPANWLCLSCAAENEPKRISCHKCHALRARPDARDS